MARTARDMGRIRRHHRPQPALKVLAASTGAPEEADGRSRRRPKKLKGFAVLTGTEVDILADGSLDFPVEVLRLDSWWPPCTAASCRSSR